MAIVRQFNHVDDPSHIDLSRQKDRAANLKADINQGCLQIDTFNSRGQNPGHITQTVTLTGEALQRLKEVLDRICPN